MHPDKDIAVHHIKGLPWTQLSKRIDYFPHAHGFQLMRFWQLHIKYRDFEGKIRFKKKEERISYQVSFVR